MVPFVRVTVVAVLETVPVPQVVAGGAGVLETVKSPSVAPGKVSVKSTSVKAVELLLFNVIVTRFVPPNAMANGEAYAFDPVSAGLIVTVLEVAR